MALPQEIANELEELAEHAYVFGYPLVLMEITKNVMTNITHPNATKAPINQFAHADSLPDHTFRDVVRPNRDTLYSSAWLDLSDEPMILHVPDTAGRYYLMPMLDAWTNVFASPGERTTGTGEGNFAIVGPGWIGPLPAGLKRIDAPTNTAWIIGRTQVDGNSDIDIASRTQSEFTLTPLSAWGTSYTSPQDVAVNPDIDMDTSPAEQVASMDAQTFFGIMTESLKRNPVHPDDGRTIAAFGSLGIKPGEELNIFSLDREVVRALEAAMMGGHTRLSQTTRHLTEPENNWSIMRDFVGDFGTDYDRRAAVALIGLGANLPVDAIYPICDRDENSQALNGANNYILTFGNGELPPVDAFWSVTVYGEDLALTANPIDRYAIGDRSDLSFNPDGSLDVLIQHEDPGDEWRSNWLPTPYEPFNLTMRLYRPGLEVRSGAWIPPAVSRTRALSL